VIETEAEAKVEVKVENENEGGKLEISTSVAEVGGRRQKQLKAGNSKLKGKLKHKVATYPKI
jgi:hypothetical protein